MIDAISGIQGSYSVKKVTGYSEKEKQKLLRNFENFSKEREELHEYLSQFPKPGNHSFGELIEMAKNQ